MSKSGFIDGNNNNNNNINRMREEDLSSCSFNDPDFPLDSIYWKDWISRSPFDNGAPMELMGSLTEEPRLYVIRRQVNVPSGPSESAAPPPSQAIIYALDKAAFQAPTLQRLGLGRLNNSSYYLQTAIQTLDSIGTKLVEKKRDREDIATIDTDTGMDLLALKVIRGEKGNV